MLAKQIRFKDFLSKSSKITFKGFVLKNNNVILDVIYTVVKRPLTVNGSLDQLLIKSDANYSVVEDITFTNSEFEKDDFEIIIEFPTEVDFDNIQCVCGSNIDDHFSRITIEYKSTTGLWKQFNRKVTIPVFKTNDIGTGSNSYYEKITSFNIDDYFKNSLSSANKESNWNYTLRNLTKLKTGKHFFEMTLLNTIRNVGTPYGVTAGIYEADSVLNAWTTTSGQKGYYQSRGTTNDIRRMTGTGETIVATVSQGVPNSTLLPEFTIGVFLDLDNNLYKFVHNGVFDSQWLPLAKSKPGQEFYFYIQNRDLGPDMELIFNQPLKYEYPDLTSDWKRHFTATDGWKKYPSITVRKNKVTNPLQHVEHQWTLLNRGNLKLDLKYLRTGPEYFYKLKNYNEAVHGYGYFKNSVFIDYPPKEPTSKRVILHSLMDNKNVQLTWSDPLTGQYEFKDVKMNQPYLIYTYDSDEDYNAVILGPVYPTLMPRYKGLDLKSY